MKGTIHGPDARTAIREPGEDAWLSNGHRDYTQIHSGQ